MYMRRPNTLNFRAWFWALHWNHELGPPSHTHTHIYVELLLRYFLKPIILEKLQTKYSKSHLDNMILMYWLFLSNIEPPYIKLLRFHCTMLHL